MDLIKNIYLKVINKNRNIQYIFKYIFTHIAYIGNILPMWLAFHYKKI